MAFKGWMCLNKRYQVLSVISLGHFVIDAACIMMVVRLTGSGKPLISAFLLLLYDLLAFATQPILGYISDKYKKYGKIAALGCILTALGMVFYNLPFLAVIISGIGNALFHVGGGVVSLKLDPGKAWAPGIFIAPGTMGVFIGTLIGKQTFSPFPFIISLILLSAVHYIIKDPSMEINNTRGMKVFSERLFNAVLVLILFTVIIRSFAGLGISYVWKADIKLLLIMSVCVMLGKAMGGILSDRFGLLKVPVIGLILSVPCLILGLSYPVTGIIGMFLFNLTMPVTLLLTANLFPGHEGLGFGMTVLALSIGSIPVFSGLKLISGYPIAIVVIASAVTFFFGYRLYEKMTDQLNRRLES